MTYRWESMTEEEVRALQERAARRRPRTSPAAVLVWCVVIPLLSAGTGYGLWLCAEWGWSR